MDMLLTNQGALEAQVTEALNMELYDQNIGMWYNTIRLMGFFK